MKNSNKIALIYFSRTEKAEAKAKNWIKPYRHLNERLATSLICQSYKVVRSSGLPIFHYHEGNQRGATFGERLANAYQDVFDMGYAAAIAVGNDSPEIASIDWEQAIRYLQEGSCVLGPSLRGGAYLIGLTKAVFQKEKLSKISWQTNHTLANLIHYCSSENTPVACIDALRDINSFQDLLKTAKSSKINRAFKKLLLELLHQLQKRKRYPLHQSDCNTVFLPSVPGRAPPVAKLTLSTTS